MVLFVILWARPVLVLVEACPPSPRSQPRPAPAPLFCAAPSLAICPPFGYPRRRRLRRPVASKGASCGRRRPLRREGRGVGSGPVLASGAVRSGLRECVVLPLCQVFTIVNYTCKPVWRQRTPVKYYGGFSPSPPPFFPIGKGSVLSHPPA